MMKFLKIFLVLAVIGAILAAGAVTTAFYYFKNQIPKIETIADYKPNQGTKVYSYDGELIAEFYQDNRRNIVPYDKIPKQLKLAFVAGEDANFFKHSGVNPVAMAKAAVRYALTGKKQGGSTITQQLAKSFVGTERTWQRKIKDMLLAVELEKYLSKEEILYLYLNEIFLGGGAYGVEAASKTYFSKHIWELSLAEMATLAGLPKKPSEASPKTHPEAALKRRNYVLGRMLDEQFISKAEYETAKKEKLIVNPQKELFLDKVPYFSEKVRRYLQQKYGNKKLYEDGMTVYTTVDVRASKLANEAMFMGLRSLAKRQGYAGPIFNINLAKDLDNYLAVHKKTFGEISNDTIKRGVLYQGVVLQVNSKEALVRVGEISKNITVDNVQWARPFDPVGFQSVIKDISTVLKSGDIIIVRATDKEGTKDDFDHRSFDKPLPDNYFFVLEQIPIVQGAIIVKDPYSGYIKAIMGGYNFEMSEFDRTTQACRQPGSAIKPVFYSAALEKKNPDGTHPYTSATLILDAPVPSSDFEPENHDKTFRGDVTLWQAIIESMNAPAVRVLMDIGLPDGIAGAKKLGIKSEIKPEYGSAIGSSCVNLDELTEAFSHFPNQGKRPHTTYIRKIYDTDGQLLEDNTVYYDPFLTGIEKVSRLIAFSKRKEEQDLSPEVSYIMTRILQDVTRYGTAAAASSIDRAIGGKTGTTNDSLDAWFIGFSPEIVAGVWVGMDDYGKPLGHDETGGRAALPIWKDFMERYLKNFPKTDFPHAKNIVSAGIDRKTGLLSNNGTTMYFISGTEPKKTAEEDSVVDPSKMQ